CRDADIDKAVPIAAMAVFVHSGQICIAGSRLFVAREIHDEFVRLLAEFAGSLRVGHGIEAETEIGPLINARQAGKVEGYIKAGSDEGAELVAGGS
ncbi:aldehyde dehydrogenase family protein, partial [Mesorhizobium sp. M1C.F.Ca.ET.195.01.1.1]|uniref:aldehyde dehydrogenase family protein n=1 Tax=Mesorhizobium sp. M1C.F.Ca.ET.195.01.1.1 TaxID=2563927 RepID=UPI0010939059